MVTYATTWMMVSTEAIEDAPMVTAAINEMFRVIELAQRGFLGLVRCARCGRRTRSVYRAVDGRLFGRGCFHYRDAA